MKKHKIKSKVQSYDIRDCEEYNGILELESLLRKSSQEQKVLQMADLRRAGSFGGYALASNISSRVQPDRAESSSSHIVSEVQESHEYEDDQPINTLQLQAPNLQTIVHPDTQPAHQSQKFTEESPRLINRRNTRDRNPSKLQNTLSSMHDKDESVFISLASLHNNPSNN